MFKLLKDGFKNLKNAFAKYLSFELIYSFLASVFIIPFLTYIFNRIFLIVGKGEVLLNSDVYKLGLSFNGLAGMFVISFLAAAVLFVELGVIIFIADKSYFNESISVSDAFFTALNRLPKLIGLGIFQLFFLLLLVIPFVDNTTIPPLFDLNTDIILRELFQESMILKAIYLAVFFGVIFVYMRWIYALHFIFIENMSISKAMASSWRLTKRSKFRLVVSLIALNIVIVIGSFLIMSLFSQMASVLESKIFNDFFGNYLQLITSYLAVILSLFFIPLNVIILTHLYYEGRKEEGLSVDSRLQLKKSPVLGRFEHALKRLFKHRRKSSILAMVIFIAGTIFINSLIQNNLVYLSWDVTVAAHKGDGFNSPENSLSAVESAIEKGVAMVEIDITLTKDDVLVLSHDENLKRQANISKDIKDLTYKELQDIDVGSSFDESFAGESIPALDDILAITSKTNTRVLLDVKASGDEEVYAEEIAKLVRKYDTDDLISVQSFNPEFLKYMRHKNDEINIGQILYLYAGNLSDLDVDFYTVRETMLTKRFIKHARAENRKIWVWTVNSKKNAKKVLSYDIDGIITDYPERVQRMIGFKEEMAEE